MSARRIAKRIAKALAAIVVVVLVLVATALAVVLWTPWGTRTALRFALDRYDAAVPGSIAVGDIAGTLGGRLALDDVALWDRDDHPLVAIAHVRLELRLVDLLQLTVGFDRLEVDDLHVWVGGERAAFGDLGPEGPPKPKPAGRVGPDLPIGFAGPLAVDGLAIHRWTDGGELVDIVAHGGIAASLDSKGRDATLVIDSLWAVLPQATVAGMSATVTWADPEVRIDDLVVLSDRGVVHRGALGFDAYTQTGDAAIAAVVDLAAIAPRSQLPVHGPVAIELEGTGGAEHVWAALAVRGEPDVRIDLLLGGRITPRLELAGAGAVRLIPPGMRKPFGALLAAQAIRDPERPLLADLQLRCVGCNEPTGLLADASIDARATEIHADVFLHDARVDAAARIEKGALTSAHARAEIPSLAHVEHTLAPFLELPQLEGGVSTWASCHGRAALLDCSMRLEGRMVRLEDNGIARLGLDAAVTVDHGVPSGAASLHATHVQVATQAIDRVRVDVGGNADHLRVLASAEAYDGHALVLAGVDPGPRTSIDLRTLVLDKQTLRMRLAHPSRVTVGGGTVAIEGLRLAVNDGALGLDGVIGPHSDADVVIDRLDLGDLAPLRLPVALRGMVDARGHFAGSIASPTVGLILDADRLQVGAHALGRIGTELGLHDGTVLATVHWRPSADERIELRARAQLKRSLAGLSPRAPLKLELDADNLALSRLAPFVGEHEIDGRLDTAVRIAGSARHPTVLATVDGEALRFDDWRVEGLHARIGHFDGQLEVGIDAKARWLRNLKVAATAPVRISAVAPYYSIDRERDAKLAVVLDRLELGGLPALALAGRVDGDVSARLHDGELDARAELLATELARDGERIGTLALDTRIVDDEVHAALQASGPAVRLLELEAVVPLGVDVHARTIDWRRAAPHTLQLALADADLGVLGRLAGVGGLAGRIDGEAHLEGSAHAPKLAVDLTGRRLAYDGHPLGRVELGVDHRRGRVRASLRQTRGLQHVELDADLPIAIDFTEGGVSWDRRGQHRLALDAVAVDEQLLAAFVELPRDLELDVNAVMKASGDVDTLAATGQVRANIDTGEGLGTPLAAHLAVSPAQQTVDVVIGPFEDSAVTLVATTQAPLRAILAAEQVDWGTMPIVASIDADHFPMRGLDPLLPAALDRPDGQLDAHIGVAGTFHRPNLRGAVKLRDAALTVVPLRQRFDRVGLEIALDRQDIRLARFSARSGSGHASAKGNIHLARGDTVGHLEVGLSGLPIVRPGMPLMKLSTRATAELDARGERTEIDVVAHRTTLDVFTATPTAPAALPTTEGVVFVDARGRAASKPDDAKSTPADAREPLLPASMRVSMKLADPIFVRGPQANMTWRGGVEIARDAGEKIRATGALTVDRGRINFLGHDFIIDTGKITLPERGELDPYVAVTAVTETSEGEVTIDVHGRASKPQLRLSSDPPLPESDVFALLVTGSSEGADKGEGGEVEAKAANMLVAFQNPVLQRELQDRLGIDRVGVSFGDSVEQPIVAVGKRVSRKVYLETRYHHNAPKTENTAEIHVEYTIKAPHWSVETFFGDAAKGGLELWWRKRFGRPPAPQATAQQKSNRRGGRW